MAQRYTISNYETNTGGKRKNACEDNVIELPSIVGVTIPASVHLFASIHSVKGPIA